MEVKKNPIHQAKPDYIDLDGDGDTNEPMKKAAKEKGGSPATKKGCFSGGKKYKK